MSYSRKSRREFLRNLACLAASGSASALIPQLRMMGTALASTSSLSGYKALVCVYLAGGNDSWNVLVPHDATRYASYLNARGGTYNSTSNPGGLALANPAAGDSQIIVDGNDVNASTNQYFLHPSLTNLATLYKQNNLALIVNAGTLVEPINMIDYNANSAVRPPQLFSHADQENLWHQANTIAGSTLGWGGLCADDLQGQGANLTSNPKLSLCVSVSGANRFEIGNLVTPYQMSSAGLTALKAVCNPACSGGSSNTSVRNTALRDLLGDTTAPNPISYASDFASEYQSIFQRGRNLYGMLSSGLAAPTTPFPNTTLGNELKMVAEMIKLSRAANYASRQIYYVRVGGFDLHSGMFSASPSANNHAGLLGQVDAALGAFWTEMGVQSAQSDVVAFTASEFARTLQSNGAGSDHGWGAVQMVLGGAVNGGKLYSDGSGKIKGFPDQTFSDGVMTFSRGQCIPGISVDQYAATIASWLGVSGTSVGTIFPNLGNFGSSNLGFV